ncbi:hypothetical protein V1264_022525 [Littorina saxatilis]|uniref:Uncharacterized protein n=1 Tax=Littorina saxatilis TaxID=31220 RepID=A0AAN9FXJ7_9CAEN
MYSYAPCECWRESFHCSWLVCVTGKIVGKSSRVNLALVHCGQDTREVLEACVVLGVPVVVR